MCFIKITSLEKSHDLLKKVLDCHIAIQKSLCKQGFLEVWYTRFSTHFPVTQDVMAFVEMQYDTK